MKKSDLKRKFFEKGATALRNISTIDQECYCCPICRNLYLPEALEMDALTLEHAPPQKVGGKPLALTCKECNSVAGYSVDSAVVQRQKLLDFTDAVMGQKQNFKGRAAFLIGGETLNINFEKDEGTPSIKPVRKINDPKKLKAYADYMNHLHMAGKWDGMEFTITPTATYHVKYSKIGDLKNAFIICFAFFGYRFALNERLSVVREQIMSYNKDIINYYWLPSDPTVTRTHFICLIEKPVAALAVKLDHSTVILPWIEGPENLYKYLEDNHDPKKPVSFQGRCYSWPRTLEMRLDFASAYNKRVQSIAEKAGSD
jgi:hypothetical protein